MDLLIFFDFLLLDLLVVEKFWFFVWGIFFIFGDLFCVCCDDVSDFRRWFYWMLFFFRLLLEFGFGFVFKLFVLIIIIKF